MKLPSLADALSAIESLGGINGAIDEAKSLVNIVVDLFDGKPDDQDQLKAAYEAAKSRTDAALNNLDAAIDNAEKAG